MIVSIALMSGLLLALCPWSIKAAARYGIYLPFLSRPTMYGVLQPQQQHEQSSLHAGLKVRTLEMGWNHYEPQDGVWSTTYIAEQRKILNRMRSAGFVVILDLGLQYTPNWLLELPNSRFVNQYGDPYQDNRAVNAVFNQQLRDHQSEYVRHVFASLGTDFFAVRMGWGINNEMMYPPATYNGRANSYWAFDPIAQGQVPGLPPGMSPAPQPGWRPGTPSGDTTDAAAFINWYLASLKHYHDWQLATVRAVYPGRLMMLYPSWGVRPGEIEAAVASNLSGQTSPEINGEVQRGLDFARLIEDTDDPLLVVYTTWLEAYDAEDDGSDPREWTPVHYLASLAADHPLKLAVWGENSGRNSPSEMAWTISQVQKYRLEGMLWAFEEDLYGGKYANLAEFIALTDNR